MDGLVEPLKVPSLKAACVARLEALILSGQLKIGETLPPERKLAERLGVSRPVLHEALVDLAGKGLVHIQPRHGVQVSDFRNTGSVALLDALLSYHNGELDASFLSSLMEMRMLMETETARLAAGAVTEAQIAEFESLLRQEATIDRQDIIALAASDFAFHLLVANASGNLMYPLVMNSFKPVYTNLTERFFTRNAGSGILEEVFSFHARLVQALKQKNSTEAVSIMQAMLRHGAAHL
jgi:GntR family transcriptional regulator, transcriptional repressor for pyruvate dehydrogenase complex